LRPTRCAMGASCACRRSRSCTQTRSRTISHTRRDSATGCRSSRFAGGSTTSSTARWKTCARRWSIVIGKRPRHRPLGHASRPYPVPPWRTKRVLARAGEYAGRRNSTPRAFESGVTAWHKNNTSHRKAREPPCPPAMGYSQPPARCPRLFVCAGHSLSGQELRRPTQILPPAATMGSPWRPGRRLAP
jgi:hypothetical protein